MRQDKTDKKQNDRGSAMIMVLTIISFIAILGAIAMSTALLNVKTRGLNRDSDKNFYQLEIALDEIYAQTGRLSSEILKEEYADILSGLYQKDTDTLLEPDDRLDTNDKANSRLKTEFIKEIAKEFELEITEDSKVKEENCKNAAEKLKGLATSFVKDSTVKDNFTVTVKSVTFIKSTGNAEDAAEPSEGAEVYGGLSINGLCLTYVNPETEIESALTVDLKIETPYVRFVNNGSAMLDYILVANGGIEIGAGAGTPGKTQINGNIYGNLITVNHGDVTVGSSLMTAAGNLAVMQGGALTIGPKDGEGQSRVWADGIELSAGSSLKTEDTSLFVRDDMTLQKNGNRVELKGSYYGYGNEGYSEDKIVKETKDKSSAILINDKKSTVDLRGLDSLMLAGRAYLRFNSGSEHSQYIYPMGESVAVRSTQSMYLIPEEYLTVKSGDEAAQKVGSNPFLFPDGKDSVELTVTLPAGKPTAGAAAAEKTYRITKEDLAGAGAGRLNSDDDTTAFLVSLDKKVYVYYNFENEKQINNYFEQYLAEQAESFEALLKKGGVTGEADGSGVYISDEETEASKRLLTSGVLYQVAGNEEEGKRIFELLSVGRSGVSSSLTWVEFEEQLTQSFKNIQENLAEIKRVTGKREIEDTIGASSLLPMGNYVRMSKLGKPVFFPEKEASKVILIKGNVKIKLNGTSAEISLVGSGSSMTGDMENGHGLIIASGDVTINGTGSFDGLIMAGGKINIDASSDITLNADSAIYQEALEDEKISEYFYDYSGAASTVLNQYENFVTRENWSRSGLERSDKTDE